MTQKDKDQLQENSINTIIDTIKEQMLVFTGNQPTSKQTQKIEDILYDERVYFSFRFNELSDKD